MTEYRSINNFFDTIYVINYLFSKPFKKFYFMSKLKDKTTIIINNFPITIEKYDSKIIIKDDIQVQNPGAELNRGTGASGLLFDGIELV